MNFICCSNHYINIFMPWRALFSKSTNMWSILIELGIISKPVPTKKYSADVLLFFIFLCTVLISIPLIYKFPLSRDRAGSSINGLFSLPVQSVVHERHWEIWHNAKFKNEQKSLLLHQQRRWKHWITYSVHKKQDLSVCGKTWAVIDSEDGSIHLFPPECFICDHKSHLVQLVIMKTASMQLLRII